MGSNLDLGIQLLGNFVNHILLPYGIPAIFTYLIIVEVPKIHLKAHKIYLNHLRDRKIQFYEHMRDIDKDRARLLKESAEAKESQADSAEKIIERDKQLNDLLAQVASLQEQLHEKSENTTTDDQSSLWHREIDEMTSGPSREKILNHMAKLYDLIYKKSGEVFDEIGNLKNIDMDTFAFADLHNLIMAKNGYAELTDKGKIFMKFYLNKLDEFSVK